MNDRVQPFVQRWRRTLAVLRAPRVRILVYGDARARAAYEAFTARHPRFRVTAAKRWGVALLRIPDSLDGYLGNRARHRRRKYRRALSAGYRYTLVSPRDHLDEILEINRSAPSRQGRIMAETYIDRDQVAREHEGDETIHGILDRDGRLRAYAVTWPLGEAVAFSKAIGHADHLDGGVMYLLVAEVVRWCVESREATGAPTWLMHDTFWGASEGLAYFKTRIGFEPYVVDWVWVDRPIAAPRGRQPVRTEPLAG